MCRWFRCRGGPRTPPAPPLPLVTRRPSASCLCLAGRSPPPATPLLRLHSPPPPPPDSPSTPSSSSAQVHAARLQLNSTTRTRARHGHGHGLFCGETPLGPCGSVSPQKSPCRARVRVVEFSYYSTHLLHHGGSSSG